MRADKVLAALVLFISEPREMEIAEEHERHDERDSRRRVQYHGGNKYLHARYSIDEAGQNDARDERDSETDEGKVEGLFARFQRRR